MPNFEGVLPKSNIPISDKGGVISQVPDIADLPGLDSNPVAPLQGAEDMWNLVSQGFGDGKPSASTLG